MKKEDIYEESNEYDYHRKNLSGHLVYNHSLLDTKMGC